MSRWALLRWALFSAFAVVMALVLRYGGLWQFAAVPENYDREPAWSAPLAPDAEFKTLDGNTVKISDFRGRILLLNFWATWCPPCLKEFPTLLEIVAQSEAEVVLLAVSHDSGAADIPPYLARFRPRHGAALDSPETVIALDASRETSQNLFNVVILPETFVIGREGHIQRKVVGSEVWEDPQLLNWLEELRAR